MKTFTVTFIFLLLVSSVTAQDIQYKSFRTSKYSPDLSEELHKISILPLGYSYERKLADEFTFEAGVDFSFDIYYADEDALEDYALVVNPTFHFEPRYYYNLERRYERGRNVTNNAKTESDNRGEQRLLAGVRSFQDWTGVGYSTKSWSAWLYKFQSRIWIGDR